MKITKSEFGTTSQNQGVDRYTITNAKGSYVNILTYGGIVQSFVIDDVDVVLGYDSVAEYEKNTCYFGALIGRCGNRIGGGKFTLNDKEYVLSVNNGPNHLHGGLQGFDKQIWNAQIKGDGLHLTYKSMDGEEGYPATLDVEVVYALDDENGFYIQYKAVTDGDTLCNLTNHSYFNMSGHETGNLEDISVQIFADAITECDANTLPTGKILSVKDTPFDFRKKQPLLSRISEENEQLQFGYGYDHNFVLNGEGMRLVARCDSAKTGLTLEVHTDQVGMQMYTGNYIDENMQGKHGATYGFRSAVCFETQGFPDAVNQKDFPSVVLKKDETYETTTIYHVVK
ncbi:aldose epimerase family protein [Chakrabartyella piscis]|uniref:aldose epimerase family protein n=1 Tax=Chakrabartyella piscis TaxID=2918914 RepID=UPI002958908A|nr:aldose epimerase family protein [Chakrabartyella piscis]